jgi:adenosylcobinamide kinase/adenosylcobinamide-phosphate guanylyltransferase
LEKLSEIIFVIGGCRSGKSRHALETAQALAGSRKIFMATCIPCDDEMRQRVARHRQERSSAWQTVEAPILLPEAITANGRKADAILVDCLTLWISNLLMQDETPEKIDGQIRSLTAAIGNAGCPVVLVSNEVGAGVVPDNRLARLFRDWVGSVNQTIAAMADKVIWMVAGIPITIKPD